MNTENGKSNDPAQSVAIHIDGIDPGLIKPASQIPRREDRVIPPAPAPAVRRTSAPRAPVRRDFYLRSLSDGDAEADRRADTREQEGEETPETVYENPNSAFSRVEIYRWNSRYRFYEKFAEDAERFIRKSCPECSFVPFYAALPQYTLMNISQLRYYLWWRHNARRGRYLPSDSGYILLFIFEIINLPEIIPPKVGISMMCSVYAEYREKFAYIGKQMAEWICDYSLIHNVRVPLEKLGDSAADMIKQLSLPDVVLQTGQLLTGVRAVCLASGVNYKNSPYYRDAYKEVFDRHIPAAAEIGVGAVIDKMKNGFVKRTEIRDAYFGAVISSEKKRKAVITRTDIPALDQIRAAAALVMKYAENRARALCSIPSRYSVSRLPAEAKAAMDAYFAPFAAKKISGDDCYDESLYEPQSKGIDIENAKRIERDSWENAALFEDIYADASGDGNAAAESADERRADPAPASGDGGDEFDAFVSSLGDDGAALVSAMLRSNGEFRRLCGEMNTLPDAAEERINAAAADTVGDAVTEDGEISVFYREDIERALKNAGIR